MMQLVIKRPAVKWKSDSCVPYGYTCPKDKWVMLFLRPRAASNNLSSMEVKCWMEISHCLLYKLPVITGVQVLCLHNANI